MHQPLCQQIQRCIPVADDGIELFLKPCLHHFGQGIAINFMRTLLRHAAQFLVCAFKRRRIGPLLRKERL